MQNRGKTEKVFFLLCVDVAEEVFVSGFFFLENEIEILRRFYVLNETEQISEHKQVYTFVMFKSDTPKWQSLEYFVTTSFHSFFNFHDILKHKLGGKKVQK